jgi:hypothetical protein
MGVADLDWTHLLPFGVLLFGITALGFTRRKAGRSLARREYPKLAKRLGLDFIAPAGSREVGTLTGTVDDVRVRVESDERARLVCYPPGDLGIDVRSYPHHKRTPEGYEIFSLGSRADDRWAPNRFVREGHDVQPVLVALKALIAAFGADRDRLRNFTADAEKVECVFDFGVPAYLPASVVGRVLPAMIALSRSGRGGRASSPTAAE